MKWTNPGHEYDEVGNYLCNLQTVYILGDDYRGSFYHVFSRLGLRVVFVVSSPLEGSRNNIGTTISFDEFLLLKHIDHVMLINIHRAGADEAIARLDANGYRRDCDYFIYHPGTRQNKLLELYLLYKYDFLMIPSLSIICTSVCNLNCAGCLNFTEFNPKMRHQPFASMTKEMEALFRFMDYVDLLHISGGEPLLYPHLYDYCGYVGANYRDKIGDLSITTNGTIIPSDELCELLNKYSIKLIVNDYRPNVISSIDTVIEKVESFSVSFIINKAIEWIDLAPFTSDNTGKNDNELIQHHNNCACPWSEYNDGKLYSCNYAHYAEEAAIASYDGDSYIDLYHDSCDKKILYEFRSGYTKNGYLQFCKRCAGFFNNTNKIPVAKQIPKLRNKINELEV